MKKDKYAIEANIILIQLKIRSVEELIKKETDPISKKMLQRIYKYFVIDLNRNKQAMEQLYGKVNNQ